MTCSGGSFVVDYVIVVPAGATATNGDVLPDGDALADAFLADRRASINAAFASPEATSSFLAGRVSGIAADAVQVVDRAEVAAPVPAAPAAPVPSSPPLSPPAPPGESGILAGTVSLGVLIGAIAGSIGGCLLLTLCIVLVVVCTINPQIIQLTMTRQ